jgi:hypothetical protein
MEHECSLPCSQEPGTYPNTEPDESSDLHILTPSFFKINFNIILSPISESNK